MTSLLAGAVARAPLRAADGRSGSALERVTLADGRVVVVKRVAPAWDWIMRGTHDRGRVAELWSSGLLARVPEVIQHGVLGVEADGDAWLVVMRDLADVLVPDGARLTRAQSRRIVDAAAALHAAFWTAPQEPALCPLADRYTLLSAGNARRDRGNGHAIAELVLRGWERLVELVPADVGDAVVALAEQPAPLVSALVRFPMTLVHGDLKLGNLGLGDGSVVLLDWGTQTGWAPPAVEFAWYLAVNASRIDASREELLDDVRAAGGERHQEEALRLALLGGMVQLGWDKALQASDHPDAAVRAWEADDLAWWVARSREGLEAI
jgi:aminoglycoside phosphotransferase (APT) family kinase protein